MATLFGFFGRNIRVRIASKLNNKGLRSTASAPNSITVCNEIFARRGYESNVTKSYDMHFYREHVHGLLQFVSRNNARVNVHFCVIVKIDGLTAIFLDELIYHFHCILIFSFGYSSKWQYNSWRFVNKFCVINIFTVKFFVNCDYFA